jgi:hypothetical protein
MLLNVYAYFSKYGLQIEIKISTTHDIATCFQVYPGANLGSLLGLVDPDKMCKSFSKVLLKFNKIYIM